MVKSLKQAELIQMRRSKSGLRGYAKAVRRYLLHSHTENYQNAKSSLPVNWSST